MPRQYVDCRFKPTDARSYVFHNDGEPVRTGDAVKVATRRGDAIVEVVGIDADPPTFATKPILGKAH
jgi:hypothetical protein